jgi:hypothetical protein
VLLTHSTLLAYSYLQRPYQLEPDLLERLPEMGADKVTLTLRGRPEKLTASRLHAHLFKGM